MSSTPNRSTHTNANHSVRYKRTFGIFVLKKQNANRQLSWELIFALGTFSRWNARRRCSCRGKCYFIVPGKRKYTDCSFWCGFLGWKVWRGFNWIGFSLKLCITLVVHRSLASDLALRIAICVSSVSSKQLNLQIQITKQSTQCSDRSGCELPSNDSFITIFIRSTQKIDKRNVWTVELIDVLETLVRNHNAYIRNFRNIGISLDATMRIYEMRVDSVCNDFLRLRYSAGSNGNLNWLNIHSQKPTKMLLSIFF